MSGDFQVKQVRKCQFKSMGLFLLYQEISQLSQLRNKICLLRDTLLHIGAPTPYRFTKARMVAGGRLSNELKQVSYHRSSYLNIFYVRTALYGGYP